MKKIIWRSNEDLEKLINKHGSYAGAARELDCNSETLRRHAIKLKLNVQVKTYIKKYTKINWPSDEDLINLINATQNYEGAAKILNCDPESVRKRVLNRKLKVKLKKIRYACNKSALLNEDAISYYLLGAFISDGNVSNTGNSDRASITSIDKQWIEDIQKIISPEANIKNKNKAYCFRFSDKEIINWLKTNECIPRKSLTVKLPSVPSIYLADFVRGIFDGDGSVSCKFIEASTNNRWVNNKNFRSRKISYIYNYICGSSPEFMKELSKLLLKLGFNHKLREQKNRSGYLKGGLMRDGRVIMQTAPHFRLNFSNRNSYNFLKWIYYPGHELSLHRKKDKAAEIINFYEEAS